MARYRRHRKNQSHSFGVLEIIISVGILAAFSVYVLELFVTASAREKKMQALDRAATDAVSIVETFKACEKPADLCGKFGVSPKGRDYTGHYAADDGLTAFIQVKRESANAAGGLYGISVTLRGGDGKTVYRLTGSKFFAGAA